MREREGGDGRNGRETERGESQYPVLGGGSEREREREGMGGTVERQRVERVSIQCSVVGKLFEKT